MYVRIIVPRQSLTGTIIRTYMHAPLVCGSVFFLSMIKCIRYGLLCGAGKNGERSGTFRKNRTVKS